jgi:hypothetical protein
MRIFVTVFCLVLIAAPAFADKQDVLNEYNLKPWTLMEWLGQPATLADVYEEEPNNDCSTANPYIMGDTFHGEITSGDYDFISFDGNAGDALTIGTDYDGSLPSVDTYIELWDDTCGTMLTYDDDGGPGAYSLISGYVLPYTGTYYLNIRGYSSSSIGNYICIGELGTAPTPPENDTCDMAVANGYFIVPGPIALSGDNTLANADYPLTTNTCTGYTASGRDVVWVVDMTDGMQITVTMNCGFDDSIYLIYDCDDPTGSCVAGDDQYPSGSTFTYTHVGAAMRYFLIVSAYSSGVGTFTVDGTLTGGIAVESQTWGTVKALYR